MTTQPPDLKKLREDPRDLAATLRGRALFLEDRKEVKSPQIMREAAAAILALLDAYEASIRDAELWRGLEKAIAEDLAEPPCPSWLRHSGRLT